MLTYYYGGVPGMPSGQQMYNDTVSGYQTALNQHNSAAANINRGYVGMQQQLSQVGDAQRYGLQRQFAQQGAASQQSMIDRGLFNSTIQDTQQRGINYDYANAKTGLEDTLTREQVGAKQAQLEYQNQAQQQRQGIYSGLNQFRGSAYGQQAQYGIQANLAEQQQQHELAKLSYQRSIQGSMTPMGQQIQSSGGIGSQGPGGQYNPATFAASNQGGTGSYSASYGYDE